MPLSVVDNPSKLRRTLDLARNGDPESPACLASQITLASELARMGLRTKQIMRLIGGGTRLTNEHIYRIWRDVNGRRPPSGQDLSSSISRLRTKSSRRQVSAMISAYMARGGVLDDDLDDHLDALILAWRDMSTIHPDIQIDGRLFILVMSDLRLGNHQMRLAQCRQCGLRYILVPEYGPECVFCLT